MSTKAIAASRRSMRGALSPLDGEMGMSTSHPAQLSIVYCTICLLCSLRLQGPVLTLTGAAATRAGMSGPKGERQAMTGDPIRHYVVLKAKRDGVTSNYFNPDSG